MNIRHTTNSTNSTAVLVTLSNFIPTTVKLLSHVFQGGSLDQRHSYDPLESTPSSSSSPSWWWSNILTTPSTVLFITELYSEVNVMELVLLLIFILTLTLFLRKVFHKVREIFFEPLNRVIDMEPMLISSSSSSHNHHHSMTASASRLRKRLGQVPPVYPNGWFKVCNSWELKPGQVKYIQMLGLELALYRGEKSHKAYALDAYCTHLGANLTVGGTVQGECLTCPFHHWSFKGENGHCISLGNIPISMPMIKKNGKLVENLQVRDDSFEDCKKVEYCEHRDGVVDVATRGVISSSSELMENDRNTSSDSNSSCSNSNSSSNGQQQQQNSHPLKIPSQAHTKSYLLQEKNDQIYLWFDAEGREPHWEIPSVRPNLKTHGKIAHHIYCHIQEIPENGPVSIDIILFSCDANL